MSSAQEVSSSPEPLSTAGLVDYLQYKVPAATLCGGICGSAAGYYIGGLTALYGYGFGVGGGVVSSAFYLGTYGLQQLRRRDDSLNYAISGGFNAGWMVSGVYGVRRGVLAAFLGAGIGVAYKVIGEQVYQVSRKAWIEHRLHGLYRSAPRLLTVRRPQFPPREEVINGQTGKLRKES